MSNDSQRLCKNMEIQINRTANTVLMARPRDFGCNIETGFDNEFQIKPTLGPVELKKYAVICLECIRDKKQRKCPMYDGGNIFLQRKKT